MLTTGQCRGQGSVGSLQCWDLGQIWQCWIQSSVGRRTLLKACRCWEKGSDVRRQCWEEGSFGGEQCWEEGSVGRRAVLAGRQCCEECCV